MERKCKVGGCNEPKQVGTRCLNHHREYKRLSAERHRSAHPHSPKEPLLCKDCSTIIGFSSVYFLCRKCYDLKNKTKIKEWRTAYLKDKRKELSSKARQRYSNDLNFKLKAVLRSRLNTAIKKDVKTGSAVTDLGCSIEELKKHLESQWKPGMSWKNWSKDGWHIDHIKPLASFDLSDPEQFREACRYTNLQPLWAEENLSKGDQSGAQN